MSDTPRKWEVIIRLNKQAAEFKAQLFYEKMGSDHSIIENMCFEKAVHGPGFKALGFYEKFTTLGWEVVVNFRGNAGGEIYVNSVMEWMSTLKKDDMNNLPKTITFTGTVNNKPATLSLATSRQVSKFTSKADSFYRFVDKNDFFLYTENLAEESTMLSELFMLDKGVEINRDYLKPIVPLLLSFVITNVAPRLGDRMAVRTLEIPVLYAIMTGQLRLSFQQLVMTHVWQCRNQKGKKLIPHVRLLSALLEKQEVLFPSEYTFNKPHIMLLIADVCKSEGLKYVKTKFWHKVRFGDDTKVKVLQWGKEVPCPGEMDDQDSSDEELLRRK
ncbi:hypothetical protein HanHA300_Chr03g0080581 [Helianthus annuus]|nr:hypothetical protein HanHA300_Chr03g0080581 [Helianthus annuus]KAJ0767099.1 hypothetical protein HanLR1_Chr03g0085221 [Helianthus annuus]